MKTFAHKSENVMASSLKKNNVTVVANAVAVTAKAVTAMNVIVKNVTANVTMTNLAHVVAVKHTHLLQKTLNNHYKH